MISPTDARIRELSHLIQLVLGVADRQADLLRQNLVVESRQSARMSEIARLWSELMNEHFGVGPVRSVYPSSLDAAGRVESLKIEEGPDYSLLFEIDNSGVWFRLEPRLAGLLRFLALESECESGGDRLVEFRSRQEILAHLEKTGGRSYDPQYVNKLVKKLRNALRFYDKRVLIVTNDEKGVRLLIKVGAVQYNRRASAPELHKGSNRRTGRATQHIKLLGDSSSST